MPVSEQNANSKTLIVTADDFGISPQANDAIEKAHINGILTSASLMVNAAATADAVDRARRLPGLGVGLHLVLVDGWPTLPPETIPDLVDANGKFSNHLVRTGIKIFCRKSVQRQVKSEIRAQFEAFHDTGLPLDHVNGHHHYHQHPIVLNIILELAREFNIQAVRVPYEPFVHSWQARRENFLRRLANGLFQLHRTARMKNLLKRANIRYNDYMFGLNDSGHMNVNVLTQFLAHLPEGVSEVYCHPATASSSNSQPEDLLCEQEFAALIDPAAAAILQKLNIRKTTFTAINTC